MSRKQKALFFVPSTEKFGFKVKQQGYYIFEEIYRHLEEYFDMTVEGLFPVYEKEGRRGLHDYLCSRAKEHDVLIFHFTSKPFFDFDCFERLKGANPEVKIVTLHGDDALLFPSYTAAALDGVDLIVIADAPEIAKAHRSLGRPAVYMPGFVPGRIFHPLDLEKDIPVSFTGGIKQDRMELLSFVKQRGIPVRAFGKGTEAGFLTTDRYVDVINRSQINLIFTKAGWDVSKQDMFPQGYRIPSQFKGHIGETLLCGSFALVERFDGIEADLAPGKEIAVFDGPEDMAAKIQYYLDHKDEREAVARAGLEKALKDFEAGSQVRRLANLIKGAGEAERGLRGTDSEPLPTHLGDWEISRKIKPSYYVEWHLIMGLQFLRRKQLGCAMEEFAALRYGLPSTKIFSKIYTLAKKYFGQ